MSYYLEKISFELKAIEKCLSVTKEQLNEFSNSLLKLTKSPKTNLNKMDMKSLMLYILRYIDLLRKYSQQENDYKLCFLILQHNFNRIYTVLDKLEIKNLFVKHFPEVIMHITEDYCDDIWFIKELLKKYNLCLKNSDQHIRRLLTEKRKFDYLKLFDNITNIYDYETQSLIMETIMLTFEEKFQESSQDFIPESEQLCSAFESITTENFDTDVRYFLNVINKKLNEVFSIQYKRIFFDSILFQKANGERVLWLDFNLRHKIMSFRYHKSCLPINCKFLSALEKDKDWEMVYVHYNDVSIFDIIKDKEFIIVFIKFFHPVFTPHDSLQLIINATKSMKIYISNKTANIDKLVTILPQIFNKFTSKMTSQELKDETFLKKLSRNIQQNFEAAADETSIRSISGVSFNDSLVRKSKLKFSDNDELNSISEDIEILSNRNEATQAMKDMSHCIHTNKNKMRNEEEKSKTLKAKNSKNEPKKLKNIPIFVNKTVEVNTDEKIHSSEIKQPLNTKRSSGFILRNKSNNNINIGRIKESDKTKHLFATQNDETNILNNKKETNQVIKKMSFNISTNKNETCKEGEKAKPLKKRSSKNEPKISEKKLNNIPISVNKIIEENNSRNTRRSSRLILRNNSSNSIKIGKMNESDKKNEEVISQRKSYSINQSIVSKISRFQNEKLIQIDEIMQENLETENIQDFGTANLNINLESDNLIKEASNNKNLISSQENTISLIVDKELNSNNKLQSENIDLKKMSQELNKQLVDNNFPTDKGTKNEEKIIEDSSSDETYCSFFEKQIHCSSSDKNSIMSSSNNNNNDTFSDREKIVPKNIYNLSSDELILDNEGSPDITNFSQNTKQNVNINRKSLDITDLNQKNTDLTQKDINDNNLGKKSNQSSNSETDLSKKSDQNVRDNINRESHDIKNLNKGNKKLARKQVKKSGKSSNNDMLPTPKNIMSKNICKASSDKLISDNEGNRNATDSSKNSEQNICNYRESLNITKLIEENIDLQKQIKNSVKSSNNQVLHENENAMLKNIFNSSLNEQFSGNEVTSNVRNLSEISEQHITKNINRESPNITELHPRSMDLVQKFFNSNSLSTRSDKSSNLSSKKSISKNIYDLRFDELISNNKASSIVSKSSKDSEQNFNNNNNNNNNTNRKCSDVTDVNEISMELTPQEKNNNDIFTEILLRKSSQIEKLEKNILTRKFNKYTSSSENTVSNLVPKSFITNTSLKRKLYDITDHSHLLPAEIINQTIIPESHELITKSKQQKMIGKKEKIQSKRILNKPSKIKRAFLKNKFKIENTQALQKLKEMIVPNVSEDFHKELKNMTCSFEAYLNLNGCKFEKIINNDLSQSSVFSDSIYYDIGVYNTNPKKLTMDYNTGTVSQSLYSSADDEKEIKRNQKKPKTSKPSKKAISHKLNLDKKNKTTLKLKSKRNIPKKKTKQECVVIDLVSSSDEDEVDIEMKTHKSKTGKILNTASDGRVKGNKKFVDPKKKIKVISDVIIKPKNI